MDTQRRYSAHPNLYSGGSKSQRRPSQTEMHLITQLHTSVSVLMTEAARSINAAAPPLVHGIRPQAWSALPYFSQPRDSFDDSDSSSETEDDDLIATQRGLLPVSRTSSSTSAGRIRNVAVSIFVLCSSLPCLLGGAAALRAPENHETSPGTEKESPKLMVSRFSLKRSRQQYRKRHSIAAW